MSFDKGLTTVPALRVLIVEDDAMIGSLLTELLQDMGYEIDAVVATEEDAVAAALRCRPGLLIVDQNLREGSGASAADRIMLTGPVPCVFISGGVTPPMRPGSFTLKKPFMNTDLARAISNVINPIAAPGTSLPLG